MSETREMTAVIDAVRIALTNANIPESECAIRTVEMAEHEDRGQHVGAAYGFYFVRAGASDPQLASLNKRLNDAMRPLDGARLRPYMPDVRDSKLSQRAELFPGYAAPSMKLLTQAVDALPKTVWRKDDPAPPDNDWLDVQDGGGPDAGDSGDGDIPSSKPPRWTPPGSGGGVVTVQKAESSAVFTPPSTAKNIV